MSAAGTGKTIKFIRDHVAYQGDDCVLWPFSILHTGYGNLGYEGKQHRAHRFMCILVHGPQPSPQHHASHSCHNRACVNPRHLSWKTSSENMLDKRENGTAKPLKGKRGYSLTPMAAAEIRESLGVVTVTALANKFGVTRSTINKIASGELWAPGSKGHRKFAREHAEGKQP